MTREKRDFHFETDPQQWLARARQDLDYAQIGKDKKAYVHSILLCQRALEKCLTAYLVGRGLVFTMTHDTAKLFRLAADDAFDLTKFGEAVAWLSAFKPDTPGAGGAELERALGLATELTAWVAGQVGAGDPPRTGPQG